MSERLYLYKEYLELMKATYHIPIHNTGQSIIETFKTDHGVSSAFAPAFYLIDYAAYKYLYVDEACFDVFGYTAKQWVEDGIEGYLSRWHPADFKIMNEKIFPENIKFLKSIRLDEYQNYIFSIDYRFLNANGHYIKILQRSSFIPSALPGKPLGSIGAAIDITHFRNNSSIVHTIEQVKLHTAQKSNELILKKTYHVPDISVQAISKREAEILRLIAEGFSSKQIAQKLHLSINTVNNHRRSMLQRTGCRSSAELLNYALKYGYV